jgi:hypothetical protein
MQKISDSRMPLSNSSDEATKFQRGRQGMYLVKAKNNLLLVLDVPGTSSSTFASS